MTTVDDAAVTVAVTTTLRRDVTSLLAELRRQAPRATLLLVVSSDSDGLPPLSADLTRVLGQVRCTARPCPSGYASARNAAVAATRTPYILFFDDDQWPTPQWCDAMLTAARASAADVVLGPVHAIVGKGAWAANGDVRPQRDSASGRFEGRAYSGNTLLRLHAVRSADLRFDERFNFLGGEDTHFFASLQALGASFYYCAEASARESVDPDRTTPAGRFRAGTAQSRRTTALYGRGVVTLMKRGARLGRGALLLLLGAASAGKIVAGKGLFDIGFGWAYFRWRDD